MFAAVPAVAIVRVLETPSSCNMSHPAVMISAGGNAYETAALHNHTLGKFLVAFGDIHSTHIAMTRLTGTAPITFAAFCLRLD